MAWNLGLPQRNIILDRETYRDKVMGCWRGKNVGGTLGGPLEEKFGRDELFNVSWYPELPEGGIPNDDLELQLIWFQALQEKGPGITARDLTEYWLDCVHYNFDEYGLSKANMLRGLPPPISGWHNNWFRDCMGSPIRSEIWACIAPGNPEIAARYAFQDAICDHGGGESVYGEVFNAVVESCAFVMDDKLALIRVGLRSIPRESLTYKAIARAQELFLAGTDWVEARNKIKEEFFLPLAQYSPINMGFQTIGLLYGESFEDAICKAVNCGWDTDCTGATVGAMLGIIHGASGLPDRWVEPLRDEISTNLPNGGIRHLRAPTDINVLTDQVCEIAPRVLGYWGSDTRLTCESESSTKLTAGDFDLGTEWMEEYSPDSVAWDLNTVNCVLRYENGDAAVLAPRAVRFSLEIENLHPEVLSGKVALELPPGWLSQVPCSVACVLQPRERRTWEFTATAPVAAIQDVNRAALQLTFEGRPALPHLPVVFVAGNRWLVAPARPGQTLESEPAISENGMLHGPQKGWTEHWVSGNELPVETWTGGAPGVINLLQYIQSASEQDVILGVSNTGRMKLWLNGALLHQTREVTGLRPNHGNGGGDGSNYAVGTLKQGFNQILIELERRDAPLQAHFTLGRPDQKHFKCLGHAVLDVLRTRFPWENETGR